MNEYRNSSEQLTIDFYSVEASMYGRITQAVVAKFDLQPVSNKTTSLDEVFQDFKSSNDVVSLEWNIWFGYNVNAKIKSAEPLARKIASYISNKFNL